MGALPASAPVVPLAQMTIGALTRYRGELERRLRVCRGDTRRGGLQTGLADVLAEEAERGRIDQAPVGSGRPATDALADDQPTSGKVGDHARGIQPSSLPRRGSACPSVENVVFYV